MMKLIFCAGLLCLAAATVHAAPSLFFSRQDVPELKARAEDPAYAAVWHDILTRAEQLCTPGSPGYAAPEQIDAGHAAKIQVLAHSYGRRLTQWVEALGFAYQLTGDARFGKHGAAILDAAAQRLPISDERVAKSFAGARGDIMRGFAVGLDWLGDAMTPEQKQRVEAVAADYVRNILAEANAKNTWWVPHHNFMGVALGAAGMLSLKLKDAYPTEAPRWTKACAGEITRWFNEGFDGQGAYFEGTGYASYGLTNAVRFASALLRAGGPNLFRNPHLEHVPDFFAQELLPGESVFDARNDANYAGLGDPWMLRLAEAFHSGMAKWLAQHCDPDDSPLQIVWANDVPPVAPDARQPGLAEQFGGRGLCVFRTGWETKDVMFAIESGPYHAVTHNQADKGHFTLYGLGQRWAIDSGYGNTRLPGGRDQTVAHNCILVDGIGEALSGAGAGTNGKIVAFANNAQYGYVLADATDAYNRNNAGQPGAVVEHALRHALFIRPASGVPAYAVLLDDIRKDAAAHAYTYLLHTSAANEIHLTGTGAIIRPIFTSGDAYVDTPAGAAGHGTCDWNFTAPTAGTYAVWGRVRAGGAETGKSDSFVVIMDDGAPVQWHMPSVRLWTWGRVSSGPTQQEVVFHLTAGKHRLRFATREPQAEVDRVAVVAADVAGPPFPPEKVLLDEEAEAGKVTAPMRVVRETAATRPPRCLVVVNAPTTPRFEIDSYDGHPRLNATVNAVNPEFVSLLFPLPGTAPDPAVIVHRDADAVHIEVQWPARTDRITWPMAGERTPSVTFATR